MNKDLDEPNAGAFGDGTTVYTFDEANTMLRSLKPKKFTLADTAMILLYSQSDKPLFGRVLLVKEVFLLINEVLDKNEVQDPQFVAYRYGAYSFALGTTLSNLEFSGYIQRIGQKNTRGEQFRLTNKGKEGAARIWNKLSSDLQCKIATKRMGWDQLGRDGILRLVYRKYPMYAKESYIKGRYKKISWGKDWV